MSLKMFKWTTWTNGNYVPGYTIVLAESESLARVAARDALERYVTDRYCYYFENDDEWDIEQRDELMAKIEDDLGKTPTSYIVPGDTILLEGSD